jgi:hypothetical protein
MKKLLLAFNIFVLVVTAKSQTCNSSIFTYGPNAFGTGGDINTYRQNCLTYNPDLNAVLWVNRASPLWGFSGRTSGAIQATWLNVATNVWDSMIIYRDSINQYGGRYPGGVFYNPSGNTNFANTFAVSTGPAVNTSWNGVFYSNRKISGNYHSVSAAQDSNKFCAYGMAPFYGNNSSGLAQFLNYDIQQAGTKVFVGGEVRDTSTSASANNNAVYGGAIAKCNFSSGSPLWSYDSIIPGYYFNRNGSGNGYASDGNGGRIAFSPNGMIGYWVAQGRLATAYGNSADNMLAPIVYKTINGGTTWSIQSISQGYDWLTAHPEVMKNVGKTSRPVGYVATHFKINPKHGIDLTVDSAGVLHCVATVCDLYKDGSDVDSLQFGYTYNYDYTNHHPIIWDFMTDGTMWNTLMVDSIITGEIGADPAIDTTATINPWSNAGTFLAYGARIQVSRSPSGGKIFYSWADSDPAATGVANNVGPDIHMMSYDVSNQMVSPSINVTFGTSSSGFCYFHFMSDISYYDNTKNAWVSPVVYTTQVITGPTYSGTSPVDYNYLGCGVFTTTQYTNNANVNRAQGPMGIKNSPAKNSFDCNSYPNPFSETTTISVNLKNSKPLEIKVNDVLGNLVFTKKLNGSLGENTILFDGSSLNSGVYYYTVTAGGESINKKMILQK